jgi:hypothetical protein
MPRYVTKAVECGDEWWEPAAAHIDVLVTDDKPEDTGLLDQFGERLYRLPEREPIGFRSRK